jgi:peptidoglycan/LPS O-acetylase OafA/YrhL
MRRIVELDGIRAFAILAVIAHHYYPFTTMFYGVAEFGWAGVELFFVLSGFLITSILLQLKNRPHPYKIFYARRILRIFPPYYAVLLLISIIALLQGDHFSWTKMVGRIFFLQSFANSPAVFAKILHTLQGKFPFPNPFVQNILPEAMHGFYVHGGFSKSTVPTWSLSVEEWFYVLWAPIVLHFPRKISAAICMITCLGALLIRWFGFLGFDTYFDFFSRIDVLMGGALLALWIEHRHNLPKSVQERRDAMLLWASTIALLLVAAILYSCRPILGHEIRDSRLFMVLGLPLVVLGLSGLLSHIIKHTGSTRLLHRFLRLKPLVSIGTVSYTLYLVHIPIFFLVNQAAARLGIMPEKSYTGAIAIATTSFACSLILALFSFRYFETPILAYKDRLTTYFLRDTRSHATDSKYENTAETEDESKRQTVEAISS